MDTNFKYRLEQPQSAVIIQQTQRLHMAAQSPPLTAKNQVWDQQLGMVNTQGVGFETEEKKVAQGYQLAQACYLITLLLVHENTDDQWQYNSSPHVEEI